MHSNSELNFLDQLTKIINANLNYEQFGVSELAREIGMSRSNLHRKVKALTNSSVSQFIRQVRLKKALELLRQTGFTVSEVTWKVGFGSTSYFIKCFHEHYGFPPGEVGKREISDDGTNHNNVAKIKLRKLKKYIIITIIIFVICLSFLGLKKISSLFNKANTEFVNEITLTVETRNHVSDSLKIIEAGCFEILIKDAVLRSGEKLLLDKDEFNWMYYDAKSKSVKVPMKEITATIINRDINYELVVQIKDNRINKDTILKFQINEATTLLTSDIILLSKIIIDNPKEIKPLTNNWDAFRSYYDGVQMWKAIDINNAISAIRKSMILDPNFTLPKITLAELYLFKRNNQDARIALNNFDFNNSIVNPMDSLRCRALQNKLAGNYIEVIKNYKALKSFMPADKELYYEMAEAYFGIREIEQAISNYKQALVFDDNYARAMNHLAFCYSHTGEHDLAKYWCKKYVSLDSSANSFDSYAHVFFAAGEYDSAQYFSLEGLKVDPNVEYIYRNLGYINIELGKMKSAERYLDKYINASSSAALICRGLTAKAMIYFRSEKYEMARDTCLKAKSIYDNLDLKTRNHELHYILTRSYQMLGQTEEASDKLKDMETIIVEFDINEIKYDEIFKFYKSLKFTEYCTNLNESRMQEIADLFDNSIGDKIKDWTSPFDRAYFNTRFGVDLFNQSQYLHAEERFKKALDYNPNYVQAHYYLYKIYLIINKTKQAEDHKLRFEELMKDADSEYLNQFALLN